LKQEKQSDNRQVDKAEDRQGSKYRFHTAGSLAGETGQLMTGFWRILTAGRDWM
jgi:hypothetical protein